MNIDSSYLLAVKDLVKYFPIWRGILKRKAGDVRAVDGVSFQISEAETMGLVGESGCGKTTVGRCILRLLEPTAGEVVFQDKDITKFSPKELLSFRRNMQMVFQDPQSSLNPRMTVKGIVEEPLILNTPMSESERENKVAELLAVVGLNPDHANRYPHEFSGGQRQRIGVARALALNPKLMVLDEPTSSLDVSVQAQVLNLLRDIQEDFKLAYLFISHDLAVVRQMSDSVGVMYLGKIVEEGNAEDVFSNPIHPYTQALFSAILDVELERKRKRIVLEGDVPSPVNPPKGCRFHPRCWRRSERCCNEDPPLTVLNGGHRVACHKVRDS